MFPFFIRNSKRYSEVPMTWDRARDLFLIYGDFTNSSLITVIENFYSDLNSNGFYDKMEYMYFCFADKSGGTNAQRLDQNAYNLINPKKYKLQYFGTPIADLIGTQWSSGTPKSYASTGFIFSRHKKKVDLNYACAGIYQTTNAGNSSDFGTNGTNGATMSFAMSSNLGADLYDGIFGPIQYNTNPVSTIGFNTMIRENSWDTISCRRNGSQTNLFFPYAEAIAFPDLPVLIGALGPISNNLYSNNKFNHHFAAKFSLSELASYETLINTYQGYIETALGLAVGSRKKY